jgi:hypothetical protein
LQKLILLFIVLYHTTVSANQWNNLLHFNEVNQITSNEFFLSGNINATPNEELNSTIKLLNSKYGKQIACNFPARYSYLNDNNYNIPKYNLSQCKKLNLFLDSFSKETISLVFSSEYTNNPSSAFGHTMLLFSDNNKTLDIGDAVHFSAQTNKKDDFFQYIYNGFNGQYNGYFIREPFYKKIYEYNTLEQRYMYIYNLNFTKKQIKFLLYHLFEIRKATFKYYFLDGNCATQTTDLLNIIGSYKRDKKIYYLPLDTIKEYKKHIISEDKFIPLINKLELLIQKMSVSEKKLFYKVIKTHDDIDETYPDIVKESLVYYTTFKFRRFHRWYKNYDNIMEQTYQKQDIHDNSQNPLQRTQPSNIGVGLYQYNKENYLYLHYRPLFIDIFDIQLNSMQQSSVDTFTFDIIVNNNNLYLQKFDLANIKSYTSQNKYYKPISWAIYSGLNRNNKYNTLKINHEFGIGKTINTYGKFNLNTMLTLGFDNSDIYLKPNLLLQNQLTKSLKVGVISFYKEYDQSEDYYSNSLFVTLKQNNFIYQLKYENTNGLNNKNNLIFNIKYNF